MISEAKYVPSQGDISAGQTQIARFEMLLELVTPCMAPDKALMTHVSWIHVAQTN